MLSNTALLAVLLLEPGALASPSAFQVPVAAAMLDDAHIGRFDPRVRKATLDSAALDVGKGWVKFL